MTRARIPLVVFAISTVAVLLVMGWLTRLTLGLESMQEELRTQSESERLALWRMDSVALPILMQEAIRPPQPDINYSLTVNGIQPFLPSSGLDGNSDGANFLGNGVISRFNVIQAQEPSAGVAANETNGEGKGTPQADYSYAELDAYLPVQTRSEPNAAPVDDQRLQAVQQADEPPNEAPNQAANFDPMAQIAQIEQQRRLGRNEWLNRKQAVLQNNFDNTVMLQSLYPDLQEIRAPHVVWLDGELVLLRRFRADVWSSIEGSVLDWPALKKQMLARVSDLLPDARLVAEKEAEQEPHPLRLATLPVRLVPGEAVSPPLPRWTPLRLSLLVGWIALLVTSAAVGAAVLQSVRLSERRATFVSAVTHELRTPLTTFRLYTEMLESGMVGAEPKRAKYLETMRLEAERLGHLIENVLSFSRLEKGSGGSHRETVELRGFLDRVTGSLAELAARREMTLSVVAPDLDSKDDGEPLAIRTDPGAVERILFNLVDNAGKYAASADRPEIELRVEPTADGVAFTVRDWGPGLSEDVQKRLFRPFSRSAHEAAGSAPGVGLGLALCRRLARQLGGELRLDADATNGACFVLTLPAE